MTGISCEINREFSSILILNLFFSDQAKVPKKRKFTCPVNFHLVGKKCYFFSQDSDIWDSAFYKCQDLYGELAVFKNTKQDVRLKSLLKKVKISDDHRWIGGRYDWQSLNWKWAATGNVVRQSVYKTESLTWACLVWDPAIATRWVVYLMKKLLGLKLFHYITKSTQFGSVVICNVAIAKCHGSCKRNFNVIKVTNIQVTQENLLDNFSSCNNHFCLFKSCLTN